MRIKFKIKTGGVHAAARSLPEAARASNSMDPQSRCALLAGGEYEEMIYAMWASHVG